MSNDLKRIAEAVNKEIAKNTIEIDGKTYKLELLPAIEALTIAVELSKIVLPAIANYFDGMKARELILPEEDTLFTELSLLLIKQVDNISVSDLVRVLLKGVSSQGKPLDVNQEFKGNLTALLELIEFSIKENCGDFFIEYLRKKVSSLSFLQTPMPTSDQQPEE